MSSNASAASPQGDVPATESELALMTRHGIVRTETFQYHVGGYRYSSLSDALAQAVRISAVKDRRA